jgi:hypothetical protein
MNRRAGEPPCPASEFKDDRHRWDVLFSHIGTQVAGCTVCKLLRVEVYSEPVGPPRVRYLTKQEWMP